MWPAAALVRRSLRAGTRLRIEARHVRVGGQAIYEINALPLKQAKTFFDQMKLAGHKHAIAEVDSGD